MLTEFLLATKKFHCYTHIFKCRSRTIPLVSGSAIWQESEYWEQEPQPQYPWRREHCSVMESVVELLKDSFLSSFWHVVNKRWKEIKKDLLDIKSLWFFSWYTAFAMCDQEFSPGHRQHGFEVHSFYLPIPTNPRHNLDYLSRLLSCLSFPFNISLLLSISLKSSSSAPLLYLFLILLENQPFLVKISLAVGCNRKSTNLALDFSPSTWSWASYLTS